MTAPVYFYRTAHPFSNFHPSVFSADGLTYHTAEQYLMARKAECFGDTVRLAAILSAPTPEECKRLGRLVTPYDNAVWEEKRFEVALDMLRLKFGQNAKLRAVLLETGDAPLVEASPSDRIWGIGYREADAEANRARWGQNLLGLALEHVRRELQEAETLAAQ